jgi:hypothetical protein
MSKNLTRKGLAFGALVALASSAIAGTPAFAANELNLQPSTGTTYGTIIGETFTLNANIQAGFAGSEITKLKYNVTNAGKAALTITAGISGTINGTGVVNAGAADNSNYVVTPAATSTTVVNAFTVATAATATSSVGVQAWIDSDLDSAIDAGEWSSSIQTVVFNKASEVTWTTEFTAPAIGDTKFLAYVSAAPSINVSQIANANLGVRFGKNATNAGEQYVGKSAATFDSATNKLKFNPTVALKVDEAVAVPAAIAANAAAVAGGFRYDAQAAYLAAGLGSLATLVAEANLVGSQVAYSVAAATIGSINAPATTVSDDLLVATAPVSGGADGVTTVRATATKVPVSILVQDATPAALKDTKVTVYIAEKTAGGTDTNSTTAVGNYDTSTFSAGGQTLKDTSSSVEVISFEATTNADGKVLFDLTSSAQAGDGVAIWASAQGVNVNAAAAGAVSTAAEQTVYNWTAAAPASVKNNNVQGTSAVLKQAAGSTFTLNFTVLDQFGAAIPTADKYRVAITDGTYAAGDNNFYATVSAGKASQSITLASTATGTKSYAFKVQTKGTDGNYTDAAVAGTAVSVVVGTSNAAASFTASADLVAGGAVSDTLSTTATNALTVAGTRTAKLDTEAFVAGDKNAGATNTAKGTLTTGFLVGGTVSDSTTAATYSTVTLSGANLNFVAGSTLYAAGSITIQTDANGVYGGVRVLSTKAGKQTLTITAGSVSKSYVVDFGPAAATAATVLTVDAPATVLPGRTLVVTAKAVDKFGNGVDVAATHASVTYTGPGLIVGTLPDQTDANGELTFRVLLGAADSGSATVVVKISADADTTFDETGDLSVTKTVTIGAAPVAAVVAGISGGTGKFNVAVTNAAGKSVVVKVAGKFVRSFPGTTAKRTVAVKATKGSKKVTVYVGGKLVATKTVTVK